MLCRKLHFSRWLLPAFFILLSGSIIAQSRTVTGTVVDSAGAPVVNASVVAKGSKRGTTTSSTGRFSLNVPQTTQTLVISSLNYEPQEVPIGGGNIHVSLQSSSSTLGAVTVVAVGYGTLDKREVTSAITHLSSKDLLPFGGNGALTSIQGKVAGLSITNTAPADPNSGPNIQLRGVSSRNAGLGPLYVINGVPGGNIDNLNMNDIESIDVLKGGAASAIYGTRGSNGVILITTKKGSTQPQAFYDGYMSFDLPTNRINVLSQQEFLAHNRGTDYGGSTDWFKAVTHDYAFNHKQTLQFSGGNTKTNYIVSLDYATPMVSTFALRKRSMEPV